MMRVWPGMHYPLGATWDGNGVNFAIYSEGASQVDLCLFDSPDDDDRSASNSRHRAARFGLALLPSRRAAGPVVRIPHRRPLRSD